jgi:hypothetical protein
MSSFYSIVAVAILGSLALVIGSIQLFKFIELRKLVDTAEKASAEYYLWPARTTAVKARNAWAAVSEITTGYQKQYSANEYQTFAQAAEAARLDY